MAQGCKLLRLLLHVPMLLLDSLRSGGLHLLLLLQLKNLLLLLLLLHGWMPLLLRGQQLQRLLVLRSWWLGLHGASGPMGASSRRSAH